VIWQYHVKNLYTVKGLAVLHVIGSPTTVNRINGRGKEVDGVLPLILPPTGESLNLFRYRPILYDAATYESGRSILYCYKRYFQKGGNWM